MKIWIDPSFPPHLRQAFVIFARSGQDAIEEVTSRALTLESLARINWLAHLGGGAPDISDLDKAELRRRDRQPSSGERKGGGWDGLIAILEHGALRADAIGLGGQFG